MKNIDVAHTYVIRDNIIKFIQKRDFRNLKKDLNTKNCFFGLYRDIYLKEIENIGCKTAADRAINALVKQKINEWEFNCNLLEPCTHGILEDLKIFCEIGCDPKFDSNRPLKIAIGSGHTSLVNYLINDCKVLENIDLVDKLIFYFMIRNTDDIKEDIYNLVNKELNFSKRNIRMLFDKRSDMEDVFLEVFNTLAYNKKSQFFNCDFFGYTLFPCNYSMYKRLIENGIMHVIFEQIQKQIETVKDDDFFIYKMCNKQASFSKLEDGFTINPHIIKNSLKVACINGNLNAIKILIDNGADILDDDGICIRYLVHSIYSQQEILTTIMNMKKYENKHKEIMYYVLEHIDSYKNKITINNLLENQTRCNR